MTPRLVVVGGAALLAIVGAALVSRRRAPAAPIARVALVGDSLAVGLETPLRKLVEAAGGTLAADGRTGTTARQWVSGQWLGPVLAMQPQAVFVSLGTNDMRASGDKTADFQAVAEAVRESGALLVWIDPPPMPFADPTGVRAAIRAAVPPENLFLSERVAIQRAPDKIHATPKGNAAWADAIWEWYRGAR